jgi:hypothetical protein
MESKKLERIITALGTGSALLQDPERATRAAHLLQYETGEQLRTDLKELRETLENCTVLLVDVLDGVELEPLDLDGLPELPDFDELPDLDGLPDIESLEL